MKVKIVIPKGWRKLRRGEEIKSGDRTNYHEKWEPIEADEHFQIYDPSEDLTTIRRLPRGRAARR